MSTDKRLIVKLLDAANYIVCDAKSARSYGMEETLSYSELSFLLCVERNEHSRAGQLSQYLGITNGAVAQLAQKLGKKGFIETYRLEDNRKEVYYRLSERGLTVTQQHHERWRIIEEKLMAYTGGLSEAQRTAIDGFLDTIMETIHLDKDCYIKEDGRCEKCRIHC